jgi:hypothetical protein
MPATEPSRWLAERDILLHGYWFWDWFETYQRVTSIDTVRKLVELEAPQHPYGYRSGARYHAVNALVELDQPGEWYIDRDEAMLYLWPPAPLAGFAHRTFTARHAADRAARCVGVELRGLSARGGRRGAIEITGGDAQCRARLRGT